MPANRAELRELFGKTVCNFDFGDRLMEVLTEARLAIVPLEATEEMAQAYIDAPIEDEHSNIETLAKEFSYAIAAGNLLKE